MKRYMLWVLLTLMAVNAAAQEPDSLASYAAADSLYHELSEAVVVGEIPIVKGGRNPYSKGGQRGAGV